MSPLITIALFPILLLMPTIVVFTKFIFGFSLVQASACSVTPSPGLYGKPSKSAESNTSPTFKFSARTSPDGVLINVDTPTDFAAGGPSGGKSSGGYAGGSAGGAAGGSAGGAEGGVGTPQKVLP